MLLLVQKVSWFVAWLTLDQKRIESRRHGIFLCIIQETCSKNKNEINEATIGQQVIKYYGEKLKLLVLKVAIYLTSSFMLKLS